MGGMSVPSSPLQQQSAMFNFPQNGQNGMRMNFAGASGNMGNLAGSPSLGNMSQQQLISLLSSTVNSLSANSNQSRSSMSEQEMYYTEMLKMAIMQ
jgi:hypothetical protein